MKSKHTIVPEEPAPLDDSGEPQLTVEMRALAERLTAEARALGEFDASTAADFAARPRPHSLAAADTAAAGTAGRKRGAALTLPPAVLLALLGGWGAAVVLTPSSGDESPTVATAAWKDSAASDADESAAGAELNSAENPPRALRNSAEAIGRAVYDVRSAPLEVRELLAPERGLLDDPAFSAATASDGEKIALLETALERYRSAIVYLQQRLSESQRDTMRHQQIIDSLQSEVTALREQLRQQQNQSAPAP